MFVVLIKELEQREGEIFVIIIKELKQSVKV